MIKKALIVICILSCLPFCYAQENETQSGIPQAVLDFKYFKDNYNIYYVKDWNGYEVYEALWKKAKSGGCFDNQLHMLLYDGKNVRMAKEEEILQMGFHGKIILYRERPHQ